MHNRWHDIYDSDPLLDALRRHHGALQKKFSEPPAQRRGVTPMHMGHPRRDRARFQREED